MGKHENLTGAQRAQRFRAVRRAQGLRSKQFWVPDLDQAGVRETLRREVEEVNRRDRESGVMENIDSLNAALLASLPRYDEDGGDV